MVDHLELDGVFRALPGAGGGGSARSRSRSPGFAIRAGPRSSPKLRSSRPNLVDALVVKAAAHTNVGDHDSRRHRRDFLVLAGPITASDFVHDVLSSKDRHRLRGMPEALEKDRELSLELPGGASSIARLRLAANVD